MKKNENLDKVESDRPIFLCYRQIDGKRYARWIFSALQETFENRGELSDIYFDQTAPAITDWQALHGPALERARAIVVICTPGIFSDQGPDDWVHRELDWWLENRLAAPIIVDATTEGDRWVPDKLKARWPNAQRVNLNPGLWENSRQEELAVVKRQVANQILGGVSNSEIMTVHEDLAKSQRLNLRLKIAAFSLSLLLVVLIATAYYAFQQANRALSAETKVRSVLEVALSRESDRLIERSRAKIDSDPAEAVLLAEAATMINPSVSVRDLIVSSLYRNPAWARFPKKEEPKLRGEHFPDVFDRKKHVFMTDQEIRFVLIQDSKDSQKLDLYDIDRKRIVSSMKLTTNDKVILQEPLARELFAVSGVRDSIKELQIFELTQEGLDKPVTTIKGGVHFACAYGSWPCVVSDNAGNVKLFNISTDGNVHTSIIGNWRLIHRLEFHPGGRGLLVFHGNDKTTWVYISETGEVIESKPLKLQHGEWYMYEPQLPWTLWGPEPNQIIALEPSWTRDATKPIANRDTDDAIVISALDALSGKKQILRRTNRFDSGIGRPVFKSDLRGRRILWVVQQPSYGMVSEVLMLNWLDSEDKMVVDFDVREEGLLHGKMPAQSRANIQTAVISPNGNYALVSNDIRGTSGTQAGRGKLESWNLTELDVNSSGEPDASELPVPFESHVLKLAYSKSSNRVAAFDSRGVVNVFNVRSTSPPALSLGFRIPEAIEKRLTPSVRSVGIGGRYWLVSFTTSDHRLYDLADGTETQLESLVGNHSILAAALEGNKLTLGTKHQIIVVNMENGTQETSIPLKESVKAIAISKSVISVRSEDQMILYSRSTFVQIGVVDLGAHPDIGRTVTSDESQSYSLSFAASLMEYYPEDKKLRGFLVGQDWTLNAMEATPSNGRNKLRPRKSWSMKLPFKERANRWYSIRRLVDPNIVLVLVGAYDPSNPPILAQYSGHNGKAINHFKIPSPIPEHKFFEILDAIGLPKNRVMIAFRYYPSRFSVGIWAKGGGEPLSWKEVDVPSYSKFLGWTRLSEGDLPAFAWQSNDTDVALYSGDTGQEVWSGTSHHAWPYLISHNGLKWELANDRTHKNVENRILEGGGRISELITKIGLSAEETKRIDVLRGFLQNEGLIEDSGKTQWPPNE